MNRVSKVLVIVVLMLLMIVPLAGAQEQSIVEIAVNDGRFETLVAAVVAWRSKSALVAIGVGMVMLWLIQWIG